MRWTTVRCDYCGSDATYQPDDPRLRGWKRRRDGKDACPICNDDLVAGETPGPSVHPTVRPLPARTLTQRPPRDAA